MYDHDIDHDIYIRFLRMMWILVTSPSFKVVVIMTSSKWGRQSTQYSTYIHTYISTNLTTYRASAETNSKNLKQDIIICSMGTSYRGYCANMARTILVDPPKKVGMYVCICMYVCMYVLIYMYVYLMYVCMYVCIYV